MIIRALFIILVLYMAHPTGMGGVEECWEAKVLMLPWFWGFSKVGSPKMVDENWGVPI